MTEVLVPPGWSRVRLDQISALIRGVTYRKEDSRHEAADGFTPILRATNIERELVLSDFVFVPKTGVRPEQYIRPGDIVIATSSGSSKVVGKSALSRGNFNGAFGAFCGVVRPIPGVDPRFVAHYLSSRVVRDEWSRRARGTNINNLKREDLASTPIFIPSLDEQRRIVSAIEEVTERLEIEDDRLRRVIRLLDVLLGAARDRLISEIEAPQVPLSRVGEPKSRAITDGPFGSNLTSAHYTQTGPRVIRLQNIGVGEFLDDRAHISQAHFDSLRVHSAEAGDVIVAILGDPPPRACVVPDFVGPAIVKADCVRVRVSKDFDARFVMHWLNSSAARAQARDHIHGVGRQRLRLSALKTLQMPAPSVAKQALLVATLGKQTESINRIRAAVVGALDKSNALRHAILTSAFTGTLVPSDASTDASSVLAGSVL